VPYEVIGVNNVSFYLRIEKSTGVIATTAIAVPIDEENPGVFARDGDEPRQVFAYHASSYATGTITVDGSVEEGDTATVTIENRSYRYTLKADDTLESVRDALVSLINANPEEAVAAYPVAAFRRFQLRSKIAGPAGDGITFSATSGEGDNNSVFLILSATSGQLCCANVKDAEVTTLNPAIPGETIYVYATGLGAVSPQRAADAAVTGTKYFGPELNTPNPVRISDGLSGTVSSLVGGSTANVISAGLQPGAHAVYKVVLELSPGLQVTGPFAQLTISQHIYTSNVANLPVRDPSASNVGQ
jgi:hypothetical protein